MLLENTLGGFFQIRLDAADMDLVFVLSFSMVFSISHLQTRTLPVFLRRVVIPFRGRD
jgi:hypothetical protein